MSKNYGVFNQLEKSDSLHVKRIEEDGYTILRNQIIPDEIQDFKNFSEMIYNQQVEEFGIENLKEIGEEDIVRAPFLFNKCFDQLIINDSILEIVKSTLGQKVILHLQNTIINRKQTEHHQSAWHRDIPYQNYTLSQPISLSVFYALSPFNYETGGTKLLPKSHRFENFPNDEFIEANFIQPDLNPGDVLIFDSWVYHCAGKNISNIDRYGVNHVFTAPFLKQQIDFPKLVDSRDFPNELKNLMGKEFEVAISVNDFRNKRLKKLKSE